MKSIKQIRENYNILTEKEEADIKKLTALGRAGLFDANKIPFIKRALEKDPKEMTLAERKILLNLLDQLMSQVLHSSQVYTKVKQNVMRDDLREESLDEKSDYLSKFDPRAGSSWPSEKDIPNVLILKRKSIRVFPGSQKVALYYSQALDRYISIPFGVPNLGIAEDTSEQYKKAKKNKDKSNKSDEQTDKEAVAKVISQMRSGQKRKAISNAENIPLSAAGVGSQPGALQARRAIGAAARKQLGSRLASGDLEGAAASAGYLLGKAIRSGAGYAASPVKKMASASAAQYKKGYEDLKTDVANSALVQKAKTGIGNVKLGREAAKSATPWRHNPRGSDKKIISPSASFAHKLGRLSGKVFEEENLSEDFAYGDIHDFTLPSIAKDFVPGLGTARSAERTRQAWEKGSYGMAALHGLDTAVSGVSDAALASTFAAPVGAALKAGSGAVKAGILGARTYGTKVMQQLAPKGGAKAATVPAKTEVKAVEASTKAATVPAKTEVKAVEASVKASKPKPKAPKPKAPKPKRNPFRGMRDVDSSASSASGNAQQFTPPKDFSLKAQISAPKGASSADGGASELERQERLQRQAYSGGKVVTENKDNINERINPSGLIGGALRLGGAALATTAGAVGASLEGGEQDFKQPSPFSAQAKIKKTPEPVSAKRAIDKRRMQNQLQALQQPQQSEQQNESMINTLKNISENTEFSIGDKTIVINKNIAEKIVSLYESVNRQNKRKIESMLNESVDSFKKIVEFAVRQ